MNFTVLSGRLVGDPDYKVSQDGKPYVRFRLAVDKRTKGTKDTMFLDCVAFRDRADFVHNNFGKGDAIYVMGEIEVRDWQDSSGVKHRQFDIVVNHSDFPEHGKLRGGERVAADYAPRDVVGAIAPAAPDPSDDDYDPFRGPGDRRAPLSRIDYGRGILTDGDARDSAEKVTPWVVPDTDDDYDALVESLFT